MQTFFRLKGPTLVLIDWANLFHSQGKNGWRIDIGKLYRFLSCHAEVPDIVLFHGTNGHEKSKRFLQEAVSTGFRVVTKNVKYVPTDGDHTILRRKCDFDVEIAKEILLSLDRYRGFILFSGDGDYAPIFDVLRERKKQAILVFPKERLGREYSESPERKRAIFLCSLESIRHFIEQ